MKRLWGFIDLKGIFKDIRSTWVTIALLIIIPTASSFIIGYEMQAHQIQHIPTVIVDHDNSSFSRMIEREIETNEIFKVVDYGQNDTDVQKYIESDKARVGVIIPQNFYRDLLDGKAPKVLVFYDDSQMSVTSAAKSRMAEILLSLKAGYLQNVIQGKLNIMPQVSMNSTMPMYFSYRILNNPTRNYVNFLLPGMLISVVQIGLAMFGSSLVTRKEKSYFSILAKCVIGGLIGAISIGLTLGIQFKYFDLPYRGSVSAGVYLVILFALAVVSLGAVIRLIVPDPVFSAQVSAVIVIPTSILGGYTFPLMAMPDMYKKIGYFIPFVHIGDSIRDLCVKDIDISYVMHDIKWLICFIAVMSIAAFLLHIFEVFLVTKIKYLKERKQRMEIEEAEEEAAEA